MRNITAPQLLYTFVLCVYLQCALAQRHVEVVRPAVATRLPSESASDGKIPVEIGLPPEREIKSRNVVATYPVSAGVKVLHDVSRASSGSENGKGIIGDFRSIKDVEVDDLVLLATVDGHLHARDRKTGAPRWEIMSETPMVETIYHRANKSGIEKSKTLQDDEMVWIIEPVQEGPLFIYSPDHGLQKMPMTMKQMVEELTPYQLHGRAYVGKKSTRIFSIDAKTGVILREYGTGSGSESLAEERCKAKDLDDLEDECDPREVQKTILVGKTEYVVTIERDNGELLWTLKYVEWGPNNSDRDLVDEYKTVGALDGRYIYAKHDGSIFGMHHNKEGGRAIYSHQLETAVVRVFDVVKSAVPGSSDKPFSYLILPQPQIPDQSNVDSTYVGYTESGGLFALSEKNLPFVSSGASEAICYSEKPELSKLNQMEKRKALVGVHTTPSLPASSELRGIAAPPDVIKTIGGSPSPPPALPSPIEPNKSANSAKFYFAVFPILASILYFALKGNQVPSIIPNVEKFKEISQLVMEDQQSEVIVPHETKVELKATPLVDAAERDAPGDAQASGNGTNVEIMTKEEQKDEELVVDAKDLGESKSVEAELEEGKVPKSEEPMPAGMETPRAVRFEERPKTPAPVDNATSDVPVTPTPKKKKSHRGQRGKGAKKKQAKDNTAAENDEIDRIVERAKDNIQPSTTLEPDIRVISTLGDLDSSITQINNLIVYQNAEDTLGVGSQGTIVYKGKFEGKDVAVKRMLRTFFDVAHHEVKLLQNSDDHPNVIRYYCMQQADQFLYIALEQCKASLSDVISHPMNYRDLMDIMDPTNVLHQIASGVHHLHSLKIVHRDLKPQNILVSEPRRLKREPEKRLHPRILISDFGLCKQLEADQSSFRATTAHAAGTLGWRAPELLMDEAAEPRPQLHNHSTNETSGSTSETGVIDTLSNRRATRAIDVFSMGCVFFFVLTSGGHPFGEQRYLREMNIVAGKANLAPLDGLGEMGYLAKDLIGSMIQRNPKVRPDAPTIMMHPLFWSSEKRLHFLLDVSDRFEVEKDKEKDANYKSSWIPYLEKGGKNVVRGDWIKRLDKHLHEELVGNKRRGYDGERVLDLLRAIRNKKHHYQDMKPAAKLAAGPLPDGFLNYFTSRYPDLLLHAYRVVKETGFWLEPNFHKTYYKMD